MGLVDAIYERIERARAAIADTTVVVVRTDGKLGRWAIAEFDAANVRVVDVVLGARPELPTKHIRCWVSEGGFVPPIRSRSRDGKDPGVVIAHEGYRRAVREQLRAVFGDRMLLAPAASYELLELVASACGWLGHVDRVDADPILWRSGTLQRAVDTLRRKSGLGPREADVVRGMAVRLTNAQISAQLPVGPAMVKKAGGSCFEKLGIHSREEVRWILARVHSDAG